MGAHKLTNHTAELTNRYVHGFSDAAYSKAVRLHHVAIYYDVETYAAMLQNDTGESTENHVIISVGRELRRLVELHGTVP